MSRKTTSITAILLISLAALVLTSTGSGAPESIQSIDAKLSPSKLSKKKWKPAQIAITIRTQNNDQATDQPVNFQNQPPAATRTVVDFPKNMRFDTNAVPRCKVDSTALASTTTETATDLCGKKSIVSVGEKPPEGETFWNPKKTGAIQRVGSMTGWSDFSFIVTAFNGKQPNTIYLHARGTMLPITAVLVGKLTKHKSSSLSNGPSLDVTVPVLAAGGIQTFKTTVKAGKYVQARCKQKTMKYGARSWFDSGPTTDHTPTQATSSQKCKQKKDKKHKKH